MKHIWSVLCQKSAIDKETNLISLFECLEQISAVIGVKKAKAKDKLVIPIDFQIVSFWTDEDSSKDRKFQVEIRLFDSDHKVLENFPGEYIFKKGIIRFRSRIIVHGLPVTKKGRYLFKVQYRRGSGKYKEVAELPLDINVSYKLLDSKL